MLAILAMRWCWRSPRPASSLSPILRDLLLANVPVLIVAVGMTLIVLTAQIDISVGSQFAICSVAAGVFAVAGLPTPAAIAFATLAGALLGALNGVLVAWVRIPSIVVTLAAMVALRDGLRWVTQGAWVQNLPPGFHWFGLSQSASDLVTIAAAAIIIAKLAWALRYLAAGRAVYATGSDANAARLAGIDPQLVVFSVFAITGALTGFAAALNAVRFEQIPSNAGLGLELKVIAAVVVGGVSITGGRGTILGAMLGVVLLGLDRPRTHLSRVQRLLGARHRRRDHSRRRFDGRSQFAVEAQCRSRCRSASIGHSASAGSPTESGRSPWCCFSRSPSSPPSVRISLRAENFFEVVRLSVELGLLSLAMTPIVITGGIDLSVGSMMALAAIVFGAAWHDGGLPIPIAARAGLVHRMPGRRAERRAHHAVRTFRRSSSRSARSRSSAASPKASRTLR